ncbi:MAG: hypothetical protein J1F02_10245 [Lachnospiraceae bacterium]|nr:hypothetical protein [Lachnospiraceae bacterium]
MRHNRAGMILVILLSVAGLSGCVHIKDLDERQSDLIAEYSAGVLLQYSDTYERRLIPQEQEEEETGSATAEPSAVTAPTPSPAPASSEGGSQTGQEPAPEETVQEVSLDTIYNIDGLEFSYDTYEFCSRYQNSTIMAGKGEMLLVVSFRIHNVSGADKKVDLKKSGITYPLDIDGEKYDPTISWLENGGLDFLSTTIPKGKTETAVLIYNVSKEKQQATEISLAVEKGEERAVIPLR